MNTTVVHRWGVLLAALLIAACGEQPPAGTESPPVGKPAEANSSTPVPVSAKPSAGLAGRTGELVNPDDLTMLFLYYDLAGLVPPFDQWLEMDNRVRMASPRERAEQRELVRPALEAGAASVGDIGLIRLSLNNARMSPYNPTYGEFTIGALSPSSVIEFNAYEQVVSVKFGNGRTAQLWKVPAAEAEPIQDTIGQFPNVTMEVLIQIQSVLPRPGGGTITANVKEYELRDTRTNATIGRVQVP